MRSLILDTLEYTYDLITKPKVTLDKIVQERRLREGVLIWIFTLILPCVSAIVQLSGAHIGAAFGALLFGCVCFILQIIFIHGISCLLGGSGTIKALAAGLGFSNIPLNFATLAESLLFILPSILVHFISIASLLWTLVLSVLAVRSAYGMSTARSTLAVCMPMIIVVCVIIILVIWFAFSVLTLVKGF
ncbi:YIP1 family protein [Megasphaera paucivorans]|uniref:Yip1 domain-containing protein n=1 Tax=Megasphaera paucivorans TaxID=349095 RepID=A0A1G9V413_9FIRM|nr:YIP1 family protein [Megasphaera paucivorans]SDM66575.1 Yip1 domain-containing protein [Megasphaera paucivorans]